ncbi:MAG: hypothetical protein HS128_09705 [Ideonella sp.]|nr:hypothetical protein [Ideonella sp.]
MVLDEAWDGSWRSKVVLVPVMVWGAVGQHDAKRAGRVMRAQPTLRILTLTVMADPRATESVWLMLSNWKR